MKVKLIEKMIKIAKIEKIKHFMDMKNIQTSIETAVARNRDVQKMLDAESEFTQENHRNSVSISPVAPWDRHERAEMERKKSEIAENISRSQEIYPKISSIDKKIEIYNQLADEQKRLNEKSINGRF